MSGNTNKKQLKSRRSQPFARQIKPFLTKKLLTTKFYENNGFLEIETGCKYNEPQVLEKLKIEAVCKDFVDRFFFVIIVKKTVIE